MEPSLMLFLAAIVFGLGFALGTAAMNGLIGLISKNR
jgi:hypothetical protein